MPLKSYASNPRSYSQLLAAGVSPAQIREAINSGLDPSQLPPEYFGMQGGYTPAPVSPNYSPPPQELGGIDIPPANMADPYAYSPTPAGSMGAFSTTPNFGFPSTFDLGSSLPSATTSYLGIPGGANTGGSISPLGGNPMGFGTSVTPDWGSLPSYNDYGWSAPDYSSVTQNYGGPMDLSGYGGMIGGGFDLYGSPIDFGSLPASPDFGNAGYSYDPAAYAGYSVAPSLTPWSEPSPIPVNDPANMGTIGFPPGSELLDPFQTAPSIGEPLPPSPDLAPSGDIPTPSDWVNGLPPLTPPPDIPDVPADVTPDGTQLPTGTGSGSGGGDSGASDAPISVPPGYTPAGFPIGYTPFAGGVGPAFSPGLGIQSLSSFYGGPLTPGGSMSMPGIPGTFVSTPSGEVYSTAVGMFGLGAMNAPGGSFSLGMGGPESGISIRTQGDAPDFAFGKAANEAAKLGMSVDDYMAMMDSATVGPTKFQTNALADPYKFWESRILQSRRMAAAGSGSQPSGPIGIDPGFNIGAARDAGMYKGWTFDPTAGTFVPPAAKPSKGTGK